MLNSWFVVSIITGTRCFVEAMMYTEYDFHHSHGDMKTPVYR